MATTCHSCLLNMSINKLNNNIIVQFVKCSKSDDDECEFCSLVDIALPVNFEKGYNFAKRINESKC